MLIRIFSLTTKMSAYSSRSKNKKVDPLSKKVPENPKYKHVRSTLDTGSSVTRYMNKIEEIRKNYKFKKDEIFKRMKITTFAQLVVQVQRITLMDAYDDIPPTPSEMGGMRGDNTDGDMLERLNGNGNRGDTSPVPSLALTEGDFGDTRSEAGTHRSTLQSVAGGIGELDLNAPAPLKPADDDDVNPYLLLDVRDADEYNLCHIVSAHSYPKAILSRATNYESKEMLAYKNREGKIIVIYDEDERTAHNCATTLVQRGYDNLFMLSGGLKVALKVIPEGLHTGTVPQSLGGPKTKQITPASQKSFTTDDIDRIEIYLDGALQDHSTGSRLSKASTVSTRMASRQQTARSTVSTGTITDRPAFK